MEILTTTLSVTLGWLFGILGPGIIDRISIKYKKDALQRIIIRELIDLKSRLSWIPYTIKSDYGMVDEELITWMKTQIMDIEKSEQNKASTDSYKKMVLENKGDLSNFLILCNTANLREDPSFHFKKMLTITIDSNIMNFGMLDDKFLKKLLELKFQINAFNEEIQCVNEYLKMTFDSSITNNNHQIIKNEIRRKNLCIAKKAIYIVEKINHIICPEKQN